MIQRLSLIAVVLGLAVSPSLCVAAKNAPLKPKLIEPGKVALEESFSGESLGKLWTQSKGAWTATDGVVNGKEKAEDKHAAVLTCRIPNHNSAIKLSFKLGKAKQFHVSYNKAKGHLFRVIIDEKGLVVRTDKPSKTSKISPKTLAKAEVKFQPNEWHTLLIEVQGQNVVVQTDNGVTLKGHHDSLDVAKPNYRFILRGEGLQLDDITITQAKP